ncbi:MAG: tetratricopeptide repeat protein [Tepidisphaeraceae bacterium]
MKAQRRHELQENELAKVIKGAPSFWQQSGGKMLAAVVAVLVIALLVRFRVNSNRQAHAQAIEGLSSARAMTEELQQIGMMTAFGPAQEGSLRRKQFFSEANNLLTDVTKLTDDRILTAEALLARGDLNWTAATLPELAGAATQPSLAVNRKELIDTAAEAYRSVADGYPDNKSANYAARFSLAAIAEDRGQWDDARGIYEKLAAETNDQPAYQQLAAERLRILPQLRKPVLLAPPATLPTQPSTTKPALPPFIAAPTTAATNAASAPATTTATATTPATKTSTTQPPK